MNADAETIGTPRVISSSATRSSTAGSFGEWIRLTPQLGSSPSSRTNSSTAASTRCGARPPAPKKPSISARAMAITIAVVAIPLAISPATYGNRTPCVSPKDRSPSHSGYSGGSAPSRRYPVGACSPATTPTPAADPCPATTWTLARTWAAIRATPSGSNAGGCSTGTRGASGVSG